MACRSLDRRSHQGGARSGARRSQQRRDLRWAQAGGRLQDGRLDLGSPDVYPCATAAVVGCRGWDGPDCCGVAGLAMATTCASSSSGAGVRKAEDGHDLVVGDRGRDRVLVVPRARCTTTVSVRRVLVKVTLDLAIGRHNRRTFRGAR
jgi:hypothetical protein